MMTPTMAEESVCAGTPEELCRQYRALLEITEAVVTHRDLGALIHDLAARLRRAVRFDFINLVLHDAAQGAMRSHVLESPEPVYACPARACPMETPGGWVWETQQPWVAARLDNPDGARFPETAQWLAERGIKSFCAVPVTTASKRHGALAFGSRQDDAYAASDVEFLRQVARQIALAVENALAFEEIKTLKDRLAEEKLYLEEELKTEYNFEEVVGRSAALRRVLKQVETVAPTDSTVLVQGETGTGKELIARAIHNLGARRARPFVKLNCAAIPTGLLESELFGHERGAFTGAIAQKVGRFELADGGTLFLDEVGDIPLELQAKLLRVLQEQEFERLGGTRTIKVNVRLVAATNADLTRMVADKQFRSDLYYRLNVFPVRMPPLRERREDIPLLVRYFAQKFARQMKRSVETIPTAVMAALTKYSWPGNVRELENFIERAVILSPGAELRAPLAELESAPEPATNHSATLEEAERDHILRALKEAKWVVGGPTGAAARLGLKRTTLQARMRKLNIARPT
jgi:formate hydrogenlyase transcriptional activator